MFELGNEPNEHGDDAATARRKRLTTIRDVKPRYSRPNLLWAINMPSQNDDGSYFTTFVNDLGGDALIRPGHNSPGRRLAQE